MDENSAREQARLRDIAARARIAADPILEIIARRTFSQNQQQPNIDLSNKVLTKRECQVLECYSIGMEGLMVAETLGIDFETVKSTTKHAREKIRSRGGGSVKNTTQAVAEAIRQGLIT